MSGITKKPLPSRLPSGSSATVAGPSAAATDGADSEPPVYSEPLINSTSRSAPNQIPREVALPGFSNVNFARYAIPDSQMSSDGTTRTTYLKVFSQDAQALLNLLNEQLALPPRPEIHIRGTEQSPGLTPKAFHLKLNMMQLLMPHAATGWQYIRLVPDGEMAFRGSSTPALKPALTTLPQWAIRFARDSASIKSFAIERSVVNWDTEYLEGRIRNVVASTGYKGHLSVTFPIMHSRVVVHTPLRVNKFWTSVVSNFVDTRQYAVVRAVWPYADAAPGVRERICAVQSEDVWWQAWKEAIRLAVIERKSGWLSLDDVLDSIMGGDIKVPAVTAAAS